MHVAVFSFAILLGAALLFLVQPMVAKMVLPLLGGSASVWVACMLFFQALLLAGYAYADQLTRRLRPRAQMVVHLAVLAGAALLALPVRLPAGWEGPGSHAPVPWLLALLALSVGPPFFALATTGPLLQAWFARTGHRHASDPYFLYAASNAGSLAGLLAYPLLLEPLLPLTRGGLGSQSGLWSAGYALYALSVLWAGAIATRGGERPREAVETGPAPTLRTGAHWMLLAFLPSSVLLGATQSLGAEVAPVPLLWVLPLSAYLLSFVLAFRPRRRLPESLWRAGLAVSAAGTVAYLWGGEQAPFAWLVVMHLAAVFTTGRVLHGRLADLRPAPAHLTTFYLWIAAGGVLGGVVNALLAPRVFDTLLEYPLALAAACLLARPRAAGSGRLRIVDVALPLLLAGVLATLQSGLLSSPLYMHQLIPLLGVALSLLWLRPRALALALVLVIGLSQVQLSGSIGVLLRERTFFGVYRVLTVTSSPIPAFDLQGRPVQLEVHPVHVLLHGITRHGAQYADPERARLPIGYYHPSGPIGRVFGDLKGKLRDVAVVGLGTGTLALYADPGGRMTFFEIDPAVVAIARDPRLFTYLRQAPGPVDVEVVDGRRGMAALPPGSLDLIVLDAFSSDAIPVHLLTREAVAMYLGKLREDGLLAVHVSNHYLDLGPVVAALAEDAGITGILCDDQVYDVQQRAEWKEPGLWIVLARHPEVLAPLQREQVWEDLARWRREDPALLWTDDRSDLLRAIRADGRP